MRCPSAFPYHEKFLSGPFERVIDRFAKMAAHLDCSEMIARHAVIKLNLGLARVSVDKLGNWEDAEDGEVVITLPIKTEGKTFDILALDPADRTRFFMRTGLATLIGSTAIWQAQGMGDSITLFPTPLDWLRGWCRFWEPHILSAIGDSDYSITDECDIESRFYPAAVFLDPNAPVLSAMRHISNIEIQDSEFAHKFAGRLKSEIAAREKSRKYPSVTLKTEETKPCH